MRAKLSSQIIKKLKPKNAAYEVVDTELSGFLLRVQPSGIMTYYFSYRTEGGRISKRKRYKIGRHGKITPTQARDEAQRLAAQVVMGSDVQAEKQDAVLEMQAAQSNTLEAFINEKYKPWVTVERKSGQANVKRILCNFKEFLSLPLIEIKPWLIENWRTEKLKRGKAATTVNRDIAALRGALSKAVEWEILETHPFAKVKPLRVDKTPKVRYLSVAEETQLRKALRDRDSELKTERTTANEWREERDYPLYLDLKKFTFADDLEPRILISLNTGVRRGELLNLSWENINFEQALLTVVGSTAKSSHTRHVPLNAEALWVLREWRKQTEGENLLFPGKEGKPRKEIKTAWKSLLEDAKITKFRWHDMRHHFASKLVMAGVDLNTVRELLGHADIKMTLRYAHLAPEHKANAVAKLVNSAYFTAKVPPLVA